jgi:N utilization substance protein A
VKRLFELEVPEIADGTVEVKSIAREAGSRTKLAVWAADPDIDPVGTCVGLRGARVGAVVDELHGEKMDIIKYSEDPAEFVAAALSPADVLQVIPQVGTKSCRVVVPDDQLSLAIGKEGQNARLAARLTGYKIDIKSETAFAALEEEEAQEEDLLLEETPAEETTVEETAEAPVEENAETSAEETAVEEAPQEASQEENQDIEAE